MEDRITPVLYLEMADRAPDEYARQRVAELTGLPGVHRGSWWEPCVPNRGDLHRETNVAEFATLGLYEADPGFVPPADAPSDVTGIRFEHCPRPGQGTLSGAPTLGLLIVLLSARSPEERQTLRDWADFIHLRDIAAAQPEHFKMITPYENTGGGEPNFMHVYELDTDDPEPAFQRMLPTTLARIGAPGTHPKDEWWLHDALVLNYANTFRRLGVMEAEPITLASRSSDGA